MFFLDGKILSLPHMENISLIYVSRVKTPFNKDVAAILTSCYANNPPATIHASRSWHDTAGHFQSV